MVLHFPRRLDTDIGLPQRITTSSRHRRRSSKDANKVEKATTIIANKHLVVLGFWVITSPRLQIVQQLYALNALVDTPHAYHCVVGCNLIIRGICRVRPRDEETRT
jgi:hypothetical protein